jgi:hypothetical protein
MDIHQISKEAKDHPRKAEQTYTARPAQKKEPKKAPKKEGNGGEAAAAAAVEEGRRDSVKEPAGRRKSMTSEMSGAGSEVRPQSGHSK